MVLVFCHCAEGRKGGWGKGEEECMWKVGIEVRYQLVATYRLLQFSMNFDFAWVSTTHTNTDSTGFVIHMHIMIIIITIIIIIIIIMNRNIWPRLPQLLALLVGVVTLWHAY